MNGAAIDDQPGVPDHVVGFYDTDKQAHDAGSERFLLQPRLVHQIRTREPVILITPRYI